ncbi:hypothetical protein PCANC_21578 [Puccinia coronata f. sp. avenae]|uniref:HTH psq-type domain-containing protein n=1 Tax=Puccinia coronata f. sp. avenae TaxID=200324 RepID=A0A2N5U8Z4_9BASI|nr:hypothetical protein PCASD_20154 [Puccinia coronata f. sp. avenae]PLW34204.1 hypothetical protein PCANC_21578 [Puccinia coronata f. sp. avenae]
MPVQQRQRRVQTAQLNSNQPSSKQASKMPKRRKKQLSTELKARIVGLSEAGMARSAIARKFGMVRQTVSGIVTRFSE